MPDEWARRVIGKFVTVKGGPIVGSDYTTTARSSSPAFPEVGSAISFRALGIRDNERWDDYSQAWAHGGLYLRRVVASGGVYLVASRVRPYREDPNQPIPRYFIETVHAAHLVSELEFSSLLQLPNQLHTDPLTVPDPNYPPLFLEPNEAFDLPDGWFDQCRSLIVAAVCGLPSVVTDRETSVDRFFQQALWAASCLPGALRWRVPIAAGFYRIPGIDKPDCQCMLALVYEPDASNKALRSDSVGESYARWFADASDHGRRCRTIEDVFNIVAAKFPALVKWNDISPSESCERAVKMLEEVPRIEALQSWLKQQAIEPPVVRNVIHLKSDVLRALSDGLQESTCGLEFLISEVAGADWMEAWERFVAENADLPSEMVAVGHLLGVLSPLNPTLIAPALTRNDLPESLVPDIAKRLTLAFGEAGRMEELSPWTALLENAFTDPRPAWFNQWVRKNQYRILWGALKLFLLKGNDVTHRWDGPAAIGGPYALQSLLRRKTADVLGLAEMIDHYLPDDKVTARQLTEFVEQSHPELAIRVAFAASLSDWLSQKLRPETLASASEEWIRALAAVGRSRTHLNRPQDRALAESLLSIWDRLQPIEMADLRRPLRTVLGSLDSLLFENRIAAETASIEDWVWRQVREMAGRNSDLCKTIISAVSQNPELVGNDFRKELIEPLLADSRIESIAPPKCLSLTFALLLRSGKAMRYEEFSGKELLAADLWTSAFRGAAWRPVQHDLTLTTVRQFPIAVAYRCAVRLFPPHVHGSFWKEWFAVVGSDIEEREPYLRYVKRAGLEGHSLWRLACGWHAVGHLASEETTAIVNNDCMAEVLKAVIRGSVTSETIASVLKAQSINRRVLVEVGDSLDSCVTLFHRVNTLLNEEGSLAFWEHVLEKVSTKGLDGIHLAISRDVIPTLRRAVQGAMLQRKSMEGWPQLAVDIYHSSSRPMQAAMVRELNNRRNEMINQESNSHESQP